MSKYKVGDKIVMEITKIFSDNFGTKDCIVKGFTRCDENCLSEHSEPLSTYTLPLEDKIHKQAAEITRLLAENERLKKENETMSVKIDCYELYGDQHEEEYNQAFNQGAEAAWELVRKIGNMPCDAAEEIFGIDFIFDLVRNDTYPEAAAKVAEWEKAKEEIKVGDEVEKNDLRDVRFIVTFTNGRLMNGVTQSGLVFANEKPKEWHKTGRHIDLDSFLK